MKTVIGKIKLLATKLWLHFICTTPMFSMTKGECDMLYNAYKKYGADKTYICQALGEYIGTVANSYPTSVDMYNHLIDKILLSCNHIRPLSATAIAFGYEPIEYRAWWINQLLRYNDYPGQLKITLTKNTDGKVSVGIE